MYDTSTIAQILTFVAFQAWIVERMGKFHRILEPGLNFLWPIIDRVKYVQSLKEIAIDVPKQSAITADNVTLSIDGVLYLRIVNAYLGTFLFDSSEISVLPFVTINFYLFQHHMVSKIQNLLSLN